MDEINYLPSPFKSENHIQKYSVDKIIEQISLGQRLDYIFFWKTDKHNLSTGCFSQWQESDFTVGEFNYSCAEQYMMAQKALLFNDKETFEKILSTINPKEMKALGRQVKNFNANAWDKAKYKIVLDGNFYKFTQNEGMMEILLSTGNKILVEASPFDKIWGIGIDEDNKNIQEPSYWKGENILGFALMEVREEIANIYKLKV
ncbi:conserved hypothetical protein [Treponema primitia ZAS-2]|uniref:NADAR domain-containing protein n=1 Tax=Treponema primitia (strain ATCC BAA-887 / DSM 12427 / ZAS-2) TaxID=545694 RepID=D8L144_TREPZ|nr:NADAR family protein [Treponema primitia]ADJ19588.1 hypothetical protein [Treponema primitia ZAS-2]AEF84426.1 conserved hypothetical protein [Treponema primitia ZAS-2]